MNVLKLLLYAYFSHNSQVFLIFSLIPNQKKWWVSGDRGEVMEEGNWKDCFLDSFVCNLYETLPSKHCSWKVEFYVGITIKQ
jgi:hypothetical protein